MFYVIERQYVGPNQGEDQYLDSHFFYVSPEPGCTNQSHEERTSGWLGTTNDWAEYAHGAYETQDDAIQKAIRLAQEEAGGYRVDEQGYVITVGDPSDPDLYRAPRVFLGAYEPMGREFTKAWIHDDMKEHVGARTSDAEIEKLVDFLAEVAWRDMDSELDRDVAFEWMQLHRDELKALEEDD